ncbi:hypothetical protein FRC00_005055 [Tulasnella sp. 408]|nr:hypothetical protein FRC00_005055 [Tulasnella sp. 408]
MASEAPDQQQTELLPCGGVDNMLGGCSHIYELSLCARIAGLCPRCRKYQEATTESDKSRIQLYGTDLVKASAAAIRAESLGRRVHANRPSGAQQLLESTSRSASASSTNSNVGASTPVEDLLALRGSGHSGETSESTIAIQWSIRLANAISGTIDKDNGAMGKTIRTLPQSTSSQQLAEYMIKESQITWKGSNNVWPLRPEYCDVRGYKNSIFPEHGAETLLKMYSWQKVHNPAGIIANSSSRSRGSKSSGQGILVLELTVFMDKYDNWTGGNGRDDSDEDVDGTRKRKKKTSGRCTRKKKSTGSEFLQPLTSKFVGEASSRRSGRPSKDQEPNYTQIRFRRTVVNMEENDDQATLETVEADEDESGWLCDVPLQVDSGDQGRNPDHQIRTKFKIGDTAFVAKEIVNLGGKGKITPSRAKDALMDELKRLELARWALFYFKKLARDKAVPLERVDVTAAFVASLVPPEGELAQYNTDDESVQVTGARHFLVEPLRSTTAVTKFSGTLSSRVATDGLSGTINAFSHYAAQCFAANRVFCDLQGSFHKSATETAFILFDPMTHSINGDSGPGDHGVEGLQAFIKSHKCSQHCKRLALESKARLMSSAKAAAEDDGVDWPEDD